MYVSCDSRRGDPATVTAARVPAVVALAAILLTLTGCTSPLTSVALREFLREAANSMTPSVDDDDDDNEDSILAAKKSTPSPEDDDPTASLAAEEASDEEPADEATKESLEDAIERSLARLADARGLDTVGRDLLIETLEKSPPEDWPAIIDSFVASLEVSAGDADPDGGSGSAPEPRGEQRAASSGEPATASTRPKSAGGLTIPVTAMLPVASDLPVQAAVHQAAVHQAAVDDVSATPVVESSIPDVAAAESPEPPDAERSQEDPGDLVASLRERLAEAMRSAPLTVRRGCFASKVRGWGSIDAFPESRFAPGQDVLVYLELDNVVGDETGGRWSTRVATQFRLIGADGTVTEQWSFEPVQDSADSPRTDYFVRYLLRMPPAAKSGSYRLEAIITDAVASKTATTELLLDIVGR